MESGFMLTNRLCCWQMLWSDSPSRWLGMEFGVWGKLFCTKFPYSSASGELDSWRIGVWIYADELASCEHISKKDRFASAV